MSRSRGLLPVALAITFGIVNGVATFGPAFKDQEREKLEKERKESGAAESAGVSEEPKAVGDAETMNGAEAPTRQQVDSAVPENSSWFRLRDGAKLATKAEDEGGKSPQTRTDQQARDSASTDPSGN